MALGWGGGAGGSTKLQAFCNFPKHPKLFGDFSLFPMSSKKKTSKHLGFEFALFAEKGGDVGAHLEGVQSGSLHGGVQPLENDHMAGMEHPRMNEFSVCIFPY